MILIKNKARRDGKVDNEEKTLADERQTVDDAPLIGQITFDEILMEMRLS